MAEQITTKELISWISKMRSLKALLAHKSLNLNPYLWNNDGIYSLLQTLLILKNRSIYTKIIESNSFSILWLQTLANYLFIYCKDLVHWVNFKWMKWLLIITTEGLLWSSCQQPVFLHLLKWFSSFNLLDFLHLITAVSELQVSIFP